VFAACCDCVNLLTMSGVLEFASLIGPLSDDPAALGAPLLLLTKVLVDAIDPAPLKSHVSEYDKGEQSLRLLQRYATECGDEDDVTAIFRDLQAFRSKGGVAHLAGSQKHKVTAALAIDGLTSSQAFASVVTRATAALATFTELMSRKLSPATE
jgi:hypothetical protein